MKEKKVKRSKTAGLLFASLLFLTVSCTEYDQVMKSSNPNLKFEKGMEYYNKGQYAKSVALFEQIFHVFKGTQNAELLNFYHAMSYYRMKDYILAGHYFNVFVRTFGNSKYREEAEFLAAYCDFLLSPRPELDQSSTYSAIDALTLFIRRHPNSDKIPQCRSLILELQDKLVHKSFINAKLYYDLGYYNSAIVALNNSLSDYPEARYREEEMFLLLKAMYLLAENSIKVKQQDRFQNTLDQYYSFVSEFPESRFIKEAEQIFEDSSKQISGKAMLQETAEK